MPVLFCVCFIGFKILSCLLINSIHFCALWIWKAFLLFISDDIFISGCPPILRSLIQLLQTDFIPAVYYYLSLIFALA